MGSPDSERLRSQVALRPLVTDSLSLGNRISALPTMGVDSAMCEGVGHCCHDRSQMTSETFQDWATKTEAREGAATCAF